MKTRFWLKIHKANKAGLAPISLRLTLLGSAEISTSIRIAPADWGGPSAKIITGTKAAAAYNKVLDILAAKATLKASQLEMLPDRTGPVTAQEVALAMRPGKVQPVVAPTPEPYLTDLLDQALRDLQGTGNTGTHVSYAASLKIWGRWPGAAQLLLAGLTASVAAAYAQWLQQTYAPTSCSTMLSGLNALLRQAAPGHPVNFNGLLKGGKSRRKGRHSLGADLTRALEQTPGLPRAEALARDIFVLQYYLHGSRVGAVLELRKDQVDLVNGRVRFLTQKRVQYKDVQIHVRLRPVLQRYLESTPGPLLLPLLPANYFSLTKEDRFHWIDKSRGIITTSLHRLTKRLQLPARLHSHMARHTAALRAYEKTGDLRVPQQMLGHASIAETAGYIASLSTKELDTIVSSVYDD